MSFAFAWSEAGHSVLVAEVRIDLESGRVTSSRSIFRKGELPAAFDDPIRLVDGPVANDQS